MNKQANSAVASRTAIKSAKSAASALAKQVDRTMRAVAKAQAELVKQLDQLEQDQAALEGWVATTRNAQKAVAKGLASESRVLNSQGAKVETPKEFKAKPAARKRPTTERQPVCQASKAEVKKPKAKAAKTVEVKKPKVEAKAATKTDFRVTLTYPVAEFNAQQVRAIIKETAPNALGSRVTLRKQGGLYNVWVDFATQAQANAFLKADGRTPAAERKNLITKREAPVVA